MRPALAVISVMLALACGRSARVTPDVPPAARLPAITSADQLLDAMHQRYQGRWYRTLTFIQKSSYMRPDGSASRVETWYEAASIPGKLRIDLDHPSRGNGALYRGDSLYSIQGGRVVDRRAARNPLLILGFDVYGQPPSRTFEQLNAEGINMSVLRTDSLDGSRVYVVGAGPADSTSNQFWVDAERMLFVRLIQSDFVGTGADRRRRTQDIRFDEYVKHGGGWVAEQVRVLVGGRVVFLEEYSAVRVDVPLDEKLFVPESWASATHWYTP